MENTNVVSVNKQVFLEVLKQKKSSIRKLGDAYKHIERTEKSIRRYLNKGKMPENILINISKYLDVHPDYLSGAYHSKIDKIEDAYLRSLSKSFLKPEKYPYIIKAKNEIDYVKYFENLLIMNDISLEMFQALDPLDRVMMRQELIVAILSVISKYFIHDALGNNLSKLLRYYESIVGDEDPFSYFYNLEGIGLTEENLENRSDNNFISDAEKRLHEKYERTGRNDSKLK